LSRGYHLMSPVPLYEAIYNCIEHGDFSLPTTVTGHGGDTMKCPKCKKDIPLVRTAPFRDSSFGGRLIMRGHSQKEGS